MFYMRIFKIILVLLSTYIIFYYTNLAKPQNSNIDDGKYCDNNTYIGYLINHNPGYVCPLGIILGKIMLIISFMQIYFIYNKKYYQIRFINLLLVIASYLLSFMNRKLQENILLAFILQFFIVILPD